VSEVVDGRTSERLMWGRLSVGALIVYATAQSRQAGKFQKILKLLSSYTQRAFGGGSDCCLSQFAAYSGFIASCRPGSRRCYSADCQTYDRNCGWYGRTLLEAE
jgi:hypothetical protein